MDVTSSPQRLKFIIEALKTNGLKFAKSVGVSQPFISSILSGRSKISRALLEKISKHYPEINTHWLLTGEGSAFLEPDQVGQKKEMVEHIHPNAVELHFLKDSDLRKTLAQNLNFIVLSYQVKKWGAGRKICTPFFLPKKKACHNSMGRPGRNFSGRGLVDLFVSLEAEINHRYTNKGRNSTIPHPVLDLAYTALDLRVGILRRLYLLGGDKIDLLQK